MLPYLPVTVWYNSFRIAHGGATRKPGADVPGFAEKMGTDSNRQIAERCAKPLTGDYPRNRTLQERLQAIVALVFEGQEDVVRYHPGGAVAIGGDLI
jgi:hypothetical protein